MESYIPGDFKPITRLEANTGNITIKIEDLFPIFEHTVITFEVFNRNRKRTLLRLPNHRWERSDIHTETFTGKQLKATLTPEEMTGWPGHHFCELLISDERNVNPLKGEFILIPVKLQNP